MSIGQIAPTCPQCDDSASSCSTCGGYSGWPNPPNDITLGPCKKCVEGIAAAALNGQAAALANPVAVRAAWIMTQGFSVDDAVESLRNSPPTDLAYERAQLDAAIHARDFAPEPLAVGDEISLILVDDEPDEAGKMFARLAVEAVNAKASSEWEGDDEPTQVLDRADVEAAAICAAAAEAIRQHEAGETLEWPDEPDADKMQAAISDIEAGRVRPIAEVIAQLAPIEETWRKTWTECADLLKAVAEKDPAAAAGHVARCRDWLTRAVQYGS